MAASIVGQEECQYQLERISDVKFEPGKLFLPIEGYETMKLVSLEEAIVPLHDVVPDIRRKAYIAKQRCQEPQDALTSDESASIFLYTMQWKPDCLYTLINQTLRSEQRELLRPWFLFLKLIFTALWKLPPISHVTVYRGVKLDLSSQYLKGKTYTWWGFSSTTQSIEVLKTPQFLGKTGVRTLFNIGCLRGKIIRNHSYYAFEDEVLLLPATQFEVTGNLDLGNDLHTITLKEVEPPFPLLEPPFVSAASRVAEPPRRIIISPTANNVSFIFEQMTEAVQYNNNARELVEMHRGKPHWSLYSQQLTDFDIKNLANELKSNKDCRNLSVTDNNITAVGAYQLAEMLKFNNTLSILLLGANQIGDEGARSICRALTNQNNTLRHLDLCNNQITDKSVDTIIEMIKTNKTLLILDLQMNQISKENQQRVKNVRRQGNIVFSSS